MEIKKNSVHRSQSKNLRVILSLSSILIVPIILSLFGFFNKSYPNSIQTPFGVVIEYLGFTFGEKHLLEARTSPSWMLWAPKESLTLSPNPKKLNVFGDKLILWFADYRNPFTGSNQGYIGYPARDPLETSIVELSDELGNRVWTVPRCQISKGEHIGGYSFDVFPRRGKTITLKLFSKGLKTPDSVISFPNPDRA